MTRISNKSFIYIPVLIVLLFFSTSIWAQSKTTLTIHYLFSPNKQKTSVPKINQLPHDNGLVGLLVGINDSNTTGKFLGYEIALEEHLISDENSVTNALSKITSGPILLHLNTKQTKQVFALATAKHLIINVGNPATELRKNICSDNIFHTSPSYPMLADALGQWLVKKQLDSVLLVSSEDEQAQDYLTALKRTLKRYRVDIIDDKKWTFTTDLRRTLEQDIPLFTQTSKDYDATIVADPEGTFGYYLPYNTYYPRPVVGSAGLRVDSWHGSIEQWGARQLQKRVFDASGRFMTSADYTHYVAVVALAQALQKNIPTTANDLVKYLRSPDFSLAAYKGRKLSFRAKNGQLRMPLALFHSRSIVSQSPQAGFMHPITELDTLGLTPNEICQ